MVGGSGASVRPVVPREASAREVAPPSRGMSTFLAVTGTSGPEPSKIPSPKTENIGPAGAPGPVADPASIVRHRPGGASALGSHRPNSGRSPITTQPRSISGLGGWASTQVLGHPAPEASCALARRQPLAPGGSTVRFGSAALRARGRNSRFGPTAERRIEGSNPIPGMGSRRLGWVEPNSGDGKPTVGSNSRSRPRSPRAVGWSWRPTGPTALGSWVVLAPDRANCRQRLGGPGARPVRPPSAVGWSGSSTGRPPPAFGWSWPPTGPTAVGGRLLLVFNHPNRRRRPLRRQE
jgi:hypothetical protein